MNDCGRHREGPYHDCNYVDTRNALIPRAEEVANAKNPRPTWDESKVRRLPGGSLDSDDRSRKQSLYMFEFANWKKAWDRTFHETMNDLWNRKKVLVPMNVLPLKREADE